MILAGAADGLVGLGRDGEVRVQRVQVGRHIARRDQAVDAVRVALLVHDPGGQGLVAERRRAGGAGARVRHRGRLAHVVHVDAARGRADEEVPLRVTRQHGVLAAAALEGGGDHGRRQQHPALRAGRSSGGLEQRRRLRRVDAHADAGEELERRRADRLDRLWRPEIGGERVLRGAGGSGGVGGGGHRPPSLSKRWAGPHGPAHSIREPGPAVVPAADTPPHIAPAARLDTAAQPAAGGGPTSTRARSNQPPARPPATRPGRRPGRRRAPSPPPSPSCGRRRSWSASGTPGR